MPELTEQQAAVFIAALGAVPLAIMAVGFFLHHWFNRSRP